MRAIKLYCKPGEIAPMTLFLHGLEGKLSDKIVYQLFRLAITPQALWREPHVKHFSIEKYNPFYELREKNKVLARVIFTVQGQDVILLAPFVKRQPRDTMRALEQSLKMLADVREHPGYAVKFSLQREDTG